MAVPRYVDKDGRRRQVAAALHRIAAREGLESVSIRTVAAEAGLSVGAVQRDFGTKEALLLFAMHEVVDAVAARLARVRIGPGLLSFAEGLRQVLTDLLPTDDERLAEARVWSAFYARAAVDAEFAEVLAGFDVRARAALRAAVGWAGEQGELAPGQDPDALVELLLVLVDGIWLSAVRQPPGSPLDAQRAAVEAAVAAVTRG
ncbi:MULTISPECIES: TetR/AcrR family transcriptional regulator [Nocardiopsis]|uniref:Transcriptional regulator, TetR family n=1 Tax=Nocardiopsis dassonvillei (strain ATCC 23218 / DSM 43111 / CIP 107115 / JCM 7437 / KCTC 9190 / NBRC 14626 / NCTC 10488 / NRRL B-5397 / IMRU 509) TaxID=446468 RepID=D7B9J6_NOCDD|nr:MULTISPECIES: TetR family transcriptional regulator C-terminal domain-containing protein [Nocardiopsis]ADH70854.1 transcriptional regulator, TetR family [Nocardiopsis dassonvillei subsp. dassonvillei DSM 43111]APC33464.1 TetR family transcriptional regulator [Nocardiopsis dassonvillei]NKY78095.1 TetR/AcrR family transcriptional regulator [Nocardiopsis dassonvillei]VEI91064.1 transcriptional regulator BetI [Nocardiopsis dassonvillei]